VVNIFLMNEFTREQFIAQLSQVSLWDVIIIGGGATGLGLAVDSASRGLKTLLLEQFDFAKGTSSRSTKLIHGGVRYLAQGNISLVYTALKERGILLRNAPHLVKKQSFIIPCYSNYEVLKYGAGLKIYDWLAGRLAFGSSRFLNAKKTIERLPDLKKEKLKGAIEYFDGQFDDARFAVSLAQTSVDGGATILNYFSVTRLVKTNGKITGLACSDNETGISYSLASRVVINAAGTFAGNIMNMDEPHNESIIRVSQGTHLVFHKKLFKGTSALMIPKTRDGRLLFVVPWHHHLLVGTTDTPVATAVNEPKPLKEEIDFILETLAPFLYRVPSKNDILSVFAGLRPLAQPGNKKTDTKEISRDHYLTISASGLVTITGGKWTTYRRMASDTINAAVRYSGLNSRAGITETLKIHGWSDENNDGFLSVYGSDAPAVLELIKQSADWAAKIIGGHPYIKAQVIWAVRKEMARAVEDVLARRIRLLFLDARAAIEAAPVVAKLMAVELNRNATWEQEQVAAFEKLAEGYLPVP
jgi:glycerol-3-phosphate dehydrogenase